MKITAFDGSPRKNGNSTAILRSFTDRAEELGADLTVYRTSELDLKECRGCLMCNVLKKCAIRNDCWNGLADEISVITSYSIHYTKLYEIRAEFICFQG